MSLKVKLASTISAFLLILGLVVMGVFAAPSATIQLGGNLIFQAKDVNAIVNGAITGAVESEALEGKVLNLETLTFNHETDVIAEGAKWSNTNLSFDSLGSQITITITIENKATDRPLYAKVEETIGEVANLNKAMTRNGNAYTGGMLTLPESTGDGTSVETIVLTMKVDDPNVSLADNLTYGYEISLQDESFATDPDNVEDVVEQEKLSYILDDTTMTASVKMVDATVTTGEIEVPMFVKDGDKVYTVTSIANRGFEKTTITSITLPDTIEVFNDYAFSACTNLTHVNMPSNLKSIGYGAFNGTKIAEIIIPDAVTTIGAWAFRSCTNLTKIDLPENLISLGGNAFNGCSNLEYTIYNNVKYLGSKNNEYFLANSVVDASATTYTLNEHCKVLGYSIFAKNTAVQQVVLPEGMRVISEYSFNRCTNLESVNILGDNIKEIGKAAFNECKKLTEIRLTEGLEKIGYFAFSYCGLAVIDKIPSTVKEIGACAFQSCSLLKDVTLPLELEYLGDYAFNHCDGATNTTITIPSTIKQIGGTTFDPENPNLDVIGTHVFYDCATTTLAGFVMEENEYFMVIDGVLYRKDAEGNPSVIIAYPPAKTDNIYEMPNTVVDSFEMAMSRPYYLKEIVLSDAYVIKEMNSDISINCFWANNLAGMLYHYTSVSKITCKETNPNYMSHNGAVYSKDGTTLYFAPILSGLKVSDTTVATLTLKEGLTTITHGSLGGESDHKSNSHESQNTNEDNQIKRYDKLYIPASVTNIDVDVIASINAQSWEIEVAEGNTVYKVNDSGKLELIA